MVHRKSKGSRQQLVVVVVVMVVSLVRWLLCVWARSLQPSARGALLRLILLLLVLLLPLHLLQRQRLTPPS